MTEPTVPDSTPNPGRRLSPQRLGLLALSLLILVGIFSVTVIETGQVAVATRSGADTPRLLTAPGIYLRVPFIERVWLIDTRLQVSEQTTAQSYPVADGQTLQLAGWLAWRVSDPLAFSVIAANGATQVDERLLKILADVISEQVRSQPVQAVLRMDTAASSAAWLDIVNQRLAPLGITAERAGLRQVGLSESTTEAIYARMSRSENRSAQQMMAALTEDQRQVTALQNRQRDQVLESAYQRSQKIRAQAEATARATYVRQFGPSERVSKAFDAAPEPPSTRASSVAETPASATAQE